MNKALFNRRVRQVHLWLGLIIGIQVGLWLISGLFMTWFSIEKVRGEHLEREIQPQEIASTEQLIAVHEAIMVSDIEAQQASLRTLGSLHVWLIEGEGERALVDAASGKLISPIAEVLATELAISHYSGRGSLLGATFYTDPPREYGRAGPVWRVELGEQDRASFYVDASTGEVRAVRTTLWRVFDFMWGLHIMDWSTRENFNSWWIKMTSALAFVFFLAGLCLAILRVLKMLQRNR